MKSHYFQLSVLVGDNGDFHYIQLVKKVGCKVFIYLNWLKNCMNKNSEYVLRFLEVLKQSSSVKRNEISRGISQADVFKFDETGLAETNEGINKNILSLIIRAQVLVNTYQSLNHGMNSEQENASQKNYFYPRLDINLTKGVSFTLRWYKSNYYTNPKTGKHFLHPERVGNTKNCNSKHFNSAPEWAKPIIMEYENKFRLIREQYEDYKDFKRSFLKLSEHHNKWLKSERDALNSYFDLKNPLKNFEFIGINGTNIKELK